VQTTQSCEAVQSGPFAGAVVTASYQIVALDSALDRLDVQLLDLRDAIQAVIETGTCYVRMLNASLCAHECPLDFLRGNLVCISGFIKALSGLIDVRHVLILKRGKEGVSPFWSDDLQEDLVGLSEEMEDAQETIAFGLSVDFRHEVEDAIQGAQSANQQKPH